MQGEARNVTAGNQGSRQSDEALIRSPAALAMGFRPFFLAAAAFAWVATGMWLHGLTAGRNPSGGYLSMNSWHAHEMIFGFTLAVVAGFLLTAARNWTGRNTLHGVPLLALVSLWALGRVAMADLLPLPPAALAALVVAFPTGLTLAVGRAIVGAGSRRNYGIVAVLAALAVASIFIHLDALGWVVHAAVPATHGALHLIVLLHVIVGGRIIPLFSRNRTGNQSIRNLPSIDRVAIGAAALAAILAIPASRQGGGFSVAFAVALATSGVSQLVRMRTWGTAASIRIPILLVLHLAYAWIGMGQLLLALSYLVPALTHTLALHALTIGTIGTMTLGMMVRVTLGHTGRTIESSWGMSVAFLMMTASALSRLAGAFLSSPGQLVSSWIVSGVFFAGAWFVYLAFAWKPLVSPRPDGRPG